LYAAADAVCTRSSFKKQSEWAKKVGTDHGKDVNVAYTQPQVMIVQNKAKFPSFINARNAGGAGLPKRHQKTAVSIAMSVSEWNGQLK
jgi:hypothetical protein